MYTLFVILFYNEADNFILIKLCIDYLQCMQESLMMIPDCHRRLEKAINELRPLYEELEKEFPEANEVTDAKAALENSDEHLKAE